MSICFARCNHQKWWRERERTQKNYLRMCTYCIWTHSLIHRTINSEKKENRKIKNISLTWKQSSIWPNSKRDRQSMRGEMKIHRMPAYKCSLWMEHTVECTNGKLMKPFFCSVKKTHTGLNWWASQNVENMSSFLNHFKYERISMWFYQETIAQQENRQSLWSQVTTRPSYRIKNERDANRSCKIADRQRWIK